MTPVLDLRGLTKRFAPHHPPVLEDISLTAHRGELLTLLGPSGCGKTTLLRLIAGFEHPDEGSIHLGGAVIAGEGRWVPPEKRGVGMVFQDYALFPHLTVLQNVAFGLTGRDRETRAREILNLVGLTVFEKRHPHQLSGGQQQRVALARALAPRPHLLLLDEPFSNLDAALRHTTRQEIRAILRRTDTTAILVTHDQEEALAFSDRLAVMRAGKFEQVGSPESVYREPKTAFVASFLGRSNLVTGTAQGSRALTPLGPVRLTEPAQGAVLVSLRPEDLLIGDEGVEADITAREFRGHDATYTVRVGGLEVVVHDHEGRVLDEGARVRISVAGQGRVVR